MIYNILLTIITIVLLFSLIFIMIIRIQIKKYEKESEILLKKINRSRSSVSNEALIIPPDETLSKTLFIPIKKRQLLFSRGVKTYPNIEKKFIFFENLLKVIKFLIAKLDKKRQNSISIIDEIHKKKQKQHNIALLLVSVSAVLYYSTNIFFHSDIKIEVLFFLFVLFIFIVISRFLVSYRIKKGYYGTNFEECKELICYLIDDKDKNNKNKGKKIFNEIGDYNEAGEVNTTVVGELEY